MRKLSKSLLVGLILATLTSSVRAEGLFSWGKTTDATYIVYANNYHFYDDEGRLMAEKAAYDTLKSERDETRSGRNKDRMIQLLLTTHANNVAFSGTGDELEREGGRISQLISTFEKRCNDLVLTYGNIQRDIAANGYERIKIFHIGPMAHADSPCSSDQEIQLPQEMAEDLPLAAILRGVDHAEFTVLMLHPDQHAPLWEYLESNRLTGKKNYLLTLLRIDETRTHINFDAYLAQLAKDGSS